MSEVDRKEKYAQLKSHPNYKLGFAKLDAMAREQMDRFVNNHNLDGQAAWITNVKRVFVNGKDRPRNWELAYELLQILA